MPEIPDSHTIALAEAVVKKGEELFSSKREERDALAAITVEDAGSKLVGIGRESVVAEPFDNTVAKRPWWKFWEEHQRRNDIVVAVDYHERLTPLQAKQLFYTHKLMETLFPDNFPKMYSSFGSRSPKEPSGTIRERVYSQDNENTPFYTLSEVRTAVKKMELPVKLDSGSTHTVMGENGKEMYLDKISLHTDRVLLTDKPSITWNLPKVQNYLDEHGDRYSGVQKKRVFDLIERIQELQQKINS